jgi:hypothetical protein
MKYVICANHKMFREFLKKFAIGKEDTYQLISSVNWHGIKTDAIIILYENYKDNSGWNNGLSEYLNIFTNVYELKRLDWIE